MYFLIGHLGDVLCFEQCIVIFVCWAGLFTCFGRHKCHIRLCVEYDISIIQVLRNHPSHPATHLQRRDLALLQLSVEHPVLLPLLKH